MKKDMMIGSPRISPVGSRNPRSKLLNAAPSQCCLSKMRCSRLDNSENPSVVVSMNHLTKSPNGPDAA